MREGDYVELVARAEQAVRAVKDPELKRVAFAKILDDLLSSRGEGVEGETPAKPRKKARSPQPARKGRSPLAYVRELADEEFFKKPKTIAQVKAELENRGRHIPLTGLSGPLQKLCQRKKLRRQKVKTTGKKGTFSYTEW
jgi:hypothetical protein